MDYTIVELPEQHLIGATKYVQNDAPDCAAQISGLWQQFMQSGSEASIPEAILYPYPCFGAYYNYDLSTNGYTTMVGCASLATSAPEGMERIAVAAGRYAKFTVHGDCVVDVGKAWMDIWTMEEFQALRAFTVDFEAYLPGDDMSNADIDIYIALK